MARVNQRYPQELRDRAVRLVLESRDDYESEWKATETLRKRVRRVEVDAGQRPGMTTQDSDEVKKLRAEVRELRRGERDPQGGGGFFAAELDRPQR
jgi:transposase